MLKEKQYQVKEHLHQKPSVRWLLDCIEKIVHCHLYNLGQAQVNQQLKMETSKKDFTHPILLPSPVHGEGLATAGLPVGEDGGVEPADCGLDQRADCRGVYGPSVVLRAVHAVECPPWQRELRRGVQKKADILRSA